ncbi:energy-coupling factor transporter transmembrane component T family protein [Treponema sp.]|uniref:energy-coupling factor transporter transmembrane component T family protein n=1 Tax=Treponema sp. TaxID=166 RepID=UPI00389095A7
MKGLLDYISGDSIFHRMNPITKLFFAFAICISCFVSSNVYILMGLLVLDVVIGLMCGIYTRTFTLLKGLIKISIFLFILQVLCIRSGNVIYEYKFIKITDNGVMNAFRLVMRLSCATLPLALMLSVTKLGDLSNSLVEKLHIPFKYAFTMTTAIRFIPVFASEMAGIMEAQTSRGIELDTKNPFKKVALILPLCAPLLVSSVRKTQSLAIAADLRGFKFRKNGSCLKNYGYKARDILCYLFSIVLLGGTIFEVVLH